MQTGKVRFFTKAASPFFTYMITAVWTADSKLYHSQDYTRDGILPHRRQHTFSRDKAAVTNIFVKAHRDRYRDQDSMCQSHSPTAKNTL